MASSDHDVYMEAFIQALTAVAHPPQPEYKGIPEDMKPLMPIFITTKMAKDKVKERNPTAAIALDMLSFLRSENIPFHLIRSYFPHKTEDEMEEALQLLEKFALARYEKQTKIVSIPRTIQEVVLETLKLHRRIVITFTYFIRLSMLILRTETAHPEFKQFVSQIIKSTEYLHAIANEEDHTKFKLMLADQVIDDHCYYWTTGRLLKETLEETKKRHGQCHSETLSIQVRIARLKTNEKKYEEAKEILEEVLTKQIGKFGEDNRQVFNTQANMGRLFGKQGLFDEGMELLKEVHGKQVTRFGAKDADSVKTQTAIDELIRDKEWQERCRRDKEAAELEKGMRELLTENEKGDAADASAEEEEGDE